MAISEALGTRHTVAVDAGELEYRERGEGPPLVFAHGAAVNGDLWRDVAPAFAGTHRVITLDLTLVAHDTGGAISQAMVMRRPERVGRLALTSCDAFDT